MLDLSSDECCQLARTTNLSCLMFGKNLLLDTDKASCVKTIRLSAMPVDIRPT